MKTSVKPVPSIPIVGGGSVASDRTEQCESAKEFLSKTTASGVIERKGVGEYSMSFDIDKLASILTIYASQVCADKDREIEVIQTDWKNKVDGWIMGYRSLEKELSAAKQTIAENDKIINESVEAVSVGLRTMIDRRKKIESLESELDKANESMAVMLRKNDELLNSVRPEVVVPSERWISGFDRYYSRPSVMDTIEEIKRLNPTLTFTELNHTAPTGDKSDEG